jgi:serine protease Do
MLKQAVFALLSVMLVFAESSPSAEAALVDHFNKAIAIENHLQGHELDPIEGIWLLRESLRGGQMFEIAIVPNTFSYPNYKQFDFVGITVDSTGFINKGETKLLVKKVSEGKYKGRFIYIMKDAMSKSIQDFDLEFSLDNETRRFSCIMPPVGLFGSEWEVQAEKTWPEDSGIKGDKPGTGTAFFVNNDVLVTNEHVVRGFKTGKIRYKDSIYQVDIIGRDEVNDLALLKVRFNDYKTLTSVNPLRMSDIYSVEAGETVFTIGYPLIRELGVSPKISMGIINSLTGMNDDPRMYQISVPLQPGNSGGPIFDENGGVIGVAASGLNVAYYMKIENFSPQNVNFAIKADYINNLLMVNADCKEMQRNIDTATYNARDIMARWRDSVVLVICE